MAQLIVDTNKLNDYANRLDNVNARLRRLDSRMDVLYRRMLLEDPENLTNLQRLMTADALTSYNYRLQKCADYLRITSRDFQNVERDLAAQDPTNFRSPGSIAQAVIQQGYDTWDHVQWWQQYFRRNKPGKIIGIGASTGVLFWLEYMQTSTERTPWSVTNSGSVFSIGSKTENSEASASFLSGSTSAGFSGSVIKHKNDDILGDEDHLNINKEQTKKPHYQVGEDEDWYDSTAILEGKAELKAEGSVLRGKVSGESEYAQGSVDAKLLTGEAHASASAGLYVYSKDKDGNTVRVFSPGVSAEVGASVAVVDVDAEGRIGLGEDNNMLGVYGKGEIQALSAEAQAKVALSANEVYAGASAEADLVKVTGTAGVSVLGTDVGVTGSLKVGAGAHAEIGYTDGKLKVDVGAAIGVGFDLGFEVDVSGTVEAISDNVDAICDTAESMWEDTKDFFSDAFSWW